MASTIIGLFDNPTDAEQARTEIMVLKIPVADIQVYDKGGFQLTGGTDTSTRGFWESLSETLAFGPSNQALYQEGVRRGGTLVSVATNDSRMEDVAAIMNRCGAVDIDMRAAEWRESGWNAASSQAGAGEVKQGAARIYRHASKESGH